MLAYFGNSIELLGYDVSSAAYESEWTVCDESHKKNLIAIMTNANSSTKISAAKIFDVNLPTFLFVRFIIFLEKSQWFFFLQILKTSYTLCNVFLSLY